MCGDLAQEVQGPCLAAPLLVLASNLEGTLGERQGFSRSGGQQIGLVQPGLTHYCRDTSILPHPYERSEGGVQRRREENCL